MIGGRRSPRGDIYIPPTDSDTYVRHMGCSMELSGQKRSDDVRLFASAGLDKHQETSWSFHPL